MPHITENMWKTTLAEIAAGKLTTRQAKKKLGTSIRQVQRRCEAAGIKARDPELPAPKKKEAAPPPSAPSPASPQPSPEVAPGKQEGNEDYRKALDAIGGPKAGPGAGAVPGPADIAAAGEKMATFCVDTLGTIKGLAITGIAEYQFRVSSDDPRIVAQKKLGAPADVAVRTNAEKLYPWLYRLMQGWGPLGAWLAMDVLMSIRAVKAVAVEQGYKPKERKPRRAEREELQQEEEQAPSAPPPGGVPAPDVRPVAVPIPGGGY